MKPAVGELAHQLLWYAVVYYSVQKITKPRRTFTLSQATSTPYNTEHEPKSSSLAASIRAFFPPCNRALICKLSFHHMHCRRTTMSSFSSPSAPAHEFSLSRRFGQDCLVLFQGTFEQTNCDEKLKVKKRKNGTKSKTKYNLEFLCF